MPFGNPYLTNMLNQYVGQQAQETQRQQAFQRQLEMQKSQADLQFDMQKRLNELAIENKHREMQEQFGRNVQENAKMTEALTSAADKVSDPRQKEQMLAEAAVYSKMGVFPVDKDTLTAMKQTQTAPSIVFNQGKQEEAKKNQANLDAVLQDINTNYTGADFANPDKLKEVLTKGEGLPTKDREYINRVAGTMLAEYRIQNAHKTAKEAKEQLPLGIAAAQKEYEKDAALYRRLQSTPKKLAAWEKSPEFIDFAARLNFNSEVLNAYEKGRGREEIYPTFGEEDLPDKGWADKINTLIAGKRAKWKLNPPGKGAPDSTASLPPVKDTVMKLRKEHPDWDVQAITEAMKQMGYK